jgi:putative adhesin/cell wall-active antibiotic response 4TMS protein YvqF
MATARPRGTGVFNGLALVLVGILLLLHNYRGFELSDIFWRWWPLLLILWGLVKLYERTIGARTGQPSGVPRITAGEVLLVLGLVALVGIVAGVDQAREHFTDWPGVGEVFSNPIDIAPKPVAANARITIRVIRGDVTVRTSDQPEIRASGKVNVRGWNEDAAKRVAQPVSAEIVQQGDGYEVRPTGNTGGDSRLSVDLDVVVPNKSLVTVRSEKGDITVADLGASATIEGQNGDVEVRNMKGDVSIDMHHGDAKISDTKGDVKVSGRGGSVEVVNATGSLTVNGVFVGPIRAEKVTKGVRFVSHRTDLTLTQLSGHLEAGSGNLEVVDAPGNLAVHTRDEDIRLENVVGKLSIDNRNGNIDVRFSSPPKDDIEISNASAGITLSLPESSSFEISADCRSGDINSEFEADSLKATKTDSGDSHLEGKYGQGRGPKITLKTSYGAISIHKTS